MAVEEIWHRSHVDNEQHYRAHRPRIQTPYPKLKTYTSRLKPDYSRYSGPKVRTFSSHVGLEPLPFSALYRKAPLRQRASGPWFIGVGGRGLGYRFRGLGFRVQGLGITIEDHKEPFHRSAPRLSPEHQQQQVQLGFGGSKVRLETREGKSILSSKHIFAHVLLVSGV